MSTSTALVVTDSPSSKATVADGTYPVEGRCNARRSSGIGYCMKLPVAGRTRCFKHGGGTPIGPASPQFKHGRRSKYLPGNVAALYQTALDNPELMSLRDEIALVDMWINTRIERTSWGETRDRWEIVISCAREINKAVASGDPGLLASAVESLTKVANAQDQSERMMDDVVELIERRRRLVDSQAKMEASLQQNITAERAILLVAALSDIVCQHVSDQETRRRIAQDLRALTMGQPSR
jgi:hypothetical protein